MNHRSIKLRELIDLDKRFNGSQKAFSDRVGLTVGQVNQWLTGHRNMKDTSAREIEKKLGYETGWFEVLDALPTKINKPTTPKGNEITLSTIESEAIKVFRNLPNDEERTLAIETMRLRVNALSNGEGHTSASKKAKSQKKAA